MRPLESKDLDEVAALVDEAVGAGYFQPADVDLRLSFVAFAGGRLAGTAVGSLQAASSTAWMPGALQAAVQSLVAQTEAVVRRPATPLLHVRELAVAPPERRRGIGAALLEAVEVAGRDAGARAAFALAWIPTAPDRPTSAGLFRRLGWRDLGIEPDFYAAAGAVCPVCGPPPCRCAARVFFKDLPLG